MMKLRERILATYRGEQPDKLPFMLDLSHWFYHRYKLPWDLSKAYLEPEYALLDYHKRHDVGFYLPNCASFYNVNFADDVRPETVKSTVRGAEQITWTFHTPIGSVARTRIWEEETYSWGIRDWSITEAEQLNVLAYAMSRRRFTPAWERYQAWVDYVGDTGVVYMPVGYSAMGYLLSYWMGIENVMYAAVDWPEAMQKAIDQINANTLDLVDLLCQSPAEVIIMGDNFSSDVQPPHFFRQWSEPFYAEAIRRLHAAGKYVAVHIDGRLRGALAMFRDCGTDCADAVTPKPMGDLTPAECFNEAGAGLILSGGVSPELWLPQAPLATFEAAVRDWMALKRAGARLIVNAGDQVPPCADEARIAIMRDIVNAEG